MSKITPEVLEELVHQAIDLYVGRMEHITSFEDFEKNHKDFTGFWDVTLSLYSKIFGKEEAKAFQKEAIKYHHAQTRGLIGSAYACLLELELAKGLEIGEYNLIIENYKNELKELEKASQKHLIKSADIMKY